ncbi:OpgC domain-containing protein [Rhodobacteraceae bacterium]|nr:OpgC domain-containing protein [Paracoccaceae bacterium]
MPNTKSVRDPRLDFFRGIALAMIYVNHIPHQIYENFTSRNFGHSDAAEGFVFMSGLAAALAYGPKLAEGFNIGAFRKIWGRSWLLYMTHLLITMWAIAIFATAALQFGGEDLLKTNAFSPLAEQPLAFLIGIATLTHQLGYVNILPMYAVMLLATPFLIRLGLRKPLALLSVSVGIWACAGLFRMNLPNYPFKGGWFFNPFAWQLVFTIGIMTGLAMKRGERLVPVRRALVILASVWLVFAAIWVNNSWMLKNLGQAMWQLRQWDVPFFLVTFDKTYLSLPRLAHLLALAYILSMPVLVPRIAAARLTAPLRLMGRHGLQVFALGTVLAILSQAIKSVHPAGLWQDTVLVIGGLFALYAFAWARDRITQRQPESIVAAPPQMADTAITPPALQTRTPPTPPAPRDEHSPIGLPRIGVSGVMPTVVPRK